MTTRSTQLAARALAAIVVIVLATTLRAAIQSGNGQAVQQQAPQPEMPFTVEVRNLLGASGPVVVEITPGSPVGPEIADADVIPSKACIQGSAISCYETTATVNGKTRRYAGHTTAEILDLGENRSVVLLIATDDNGVDLERLLSLLALDSRGALVNLLPFTRVNIGDQFQYWRGPGSAPTEVLTVANLIWHITKENRFDPHHYKLSSYKYCPAKKQFVAASQFTTERKFSVDTEDGDPGRAVFKAMMPQVKARLAAKHKSGKPACGGGQAAQQQTAGPEKPFTVEVSNLLGASGPVVVEITPGSLVGPEIADADITPTKACIRGSASSCYVTTANVDGEKKPYADHTTAETLDIGEHHSVILLEATYNTGFDSERLLSILALDSGGVLVNLLPFVQVNDGDQFQYWTASGRAPYRVLTEADHVWDVMHEGRFRPHHYKLTSYEYCPAKKQFVLAGQFTTRRKFSVEEEDDPGRAVLKAMLPQVKARLRTLRAAGKNACASRPSRHR